jgi:ketopantoate reductase
MSASTLASATKAGHQGSDLQLKFLHFDGRQDHEMTKNALSRCRVNPTSQPASPKYCIFGAGAIGGMIAARLAQAGATVSVIARGETLAAIQKDGLRLISNGETLQASVRASADPAELGPQDYVIIAVKAPSLPEVASRIGPLLGPETAVVTAMNGIPWRFCINAKGVLAGKRLTAVDPDGVIARAIPASRVIGCVVYMSCAVEAPGDIRHASRRPSDGVRSPHGRSMCRRKLRTPRSQTTR